MIGGGHTHRHVVDFDDEIGAGFDELALAGRENFGGLTGRVADQKIAGQRAGVGFFVFLRGRRGEEFAGFVAGEVARARFAHVGDDVMDHRAIRRARFGHLHPFVFFESGGNDHVLIVDRAAGRNVERLGELEDDVGLGNSPAIREIRRAAACLSDRLRWRRCWPTERASRYLFAGASDCWRSGRISDRRTTAA